MALHWCFVFVYAFEIDGEKNKIMMNLHKTVHITTKQVEHLHKHTHRVIYIYAHIIINFLHIYEPNSDMLFCVTYTVFMCWDILGLLLLFSLHSSRGHCSIFPFLSWPSFPLLLLFFSTSQSFPVFLTPIPDFFISTPSLLLFCIPYLSLPHPTVFPCKDVHKEFSSSVNNNLFTSVCLTSSVRVTGHAFVSASKGHETLSHTYSHVHIPWNEKKQQKLLNPPYNSQTLSYALFQILMLSPWKHPPTQTLTVGVTTAASGEWREANTRQCFGIAPRQGVIRISALSVWSW